MSRWQEILSSVYENISVCNKGSALSDFITSHSEENLKNYVFLYHLPQDANEEKTLYHFLSEYPIAKRMLVLVNSPDNDQGIRLLYAGVHGYANV